MSPIFQARGVGLSLSFDMNEENNGFGPLAKRRGLTAKYVAASALFVAVGCLFYLARFDAGAFYLGLSFLAILLGELLRRAFLLFEEFQHRHTRYEGKWKKICRATFAFQQWPILLILSVVSIVFVIFGREHLLNCSTNRLIFGINVVILPALGFLVGLRQPSPVEESELSERENRNVADGLAWSYYFGYLKIVLPELLGKINSSGINRYRMPLKLFILLPKDCSVRKLIKEADENVQEAEALEELKIDQAGIKGRSYKHTVHKILDGGKEQYLVVEYATPLKTLFDMSRSEVGALSRDERDQQVMIFIRKLKEILDSDKECRGKYELITFAGEGSNIADILLRAIKDSSIVLPEHEEVHT